MVFPPMVRQLHQQHGHQRIRLRCRYYHRHAELQHLGGDGYWGNTTSGEVLMWPGESRSPKGRSSRATAAWECGCA